MLRQFQHVSTIFRLNPSIHSCAPSFLYFNLMGHSLAHSCFSAVSIRQSVTACTSRICLQESIPRISKGPSAPNIHSLINHPTVTIKQDSHDTKAETHGSSFCRSHTSCSFPVSFIIFVGTHPTEEGCNGKLLNFHSWWNICSAKHAEPLNHLDHPLDPPRIKDSHCVVYHTFRHLRA